MQILLVRESNVLKYRSFWDSGSAQYSLIHSGSMFYNNCGSGTVRVRQCQTLEIRVQIIKISIRFEFGSGSKKMKI